MQARGQGRLLLLLLLPPALHGPLHGRRWLRVSCQGHAGPAWAPGCGLGGWERAAGAAGGEVLLAAARHALGTVAGPWKQVYTMDS